MMERTGSDQYMDEIEYAYHYIDRDMLRIAQAFLDKAQFIRDNLEIEAYALTVWGMS